jgi:hypothetical protein
VTTQTSTTNVTLVSVALLFSSLSIVMYHHMTYQMVYDGDVTRHSQGLTLSVLCLASDWCNWSNQPSMYTKKWYLQHIGAPCEDTPEGRGFCIGSPGRQSDAHQIRCLDMIVSFASFSIANRGVRPELVMCRRPCGFHSQPLQSSPLPQRVLSFVKT